MFVDTMLISQAAKSPYGISREFSVWYKFFAHLRQYGPWAQLGKMRKYLKLDKIFVSDRCVLEDKQIRATLFANEKNGGKHKC